MDMLDGVSEAQRQSGRSVNSRIGMGCIDKWDSHFHAARKLRHSFLAT